GRDTAVSAERIRTLTGYMPEHDCLPPDVTGTEFVTHLGRMSGLPATAAKERAAESLRHVGLHEERYRLIGTYSTGMKQRVKLAQALVGDPRLLLLDEPTTGLDPGGRGAMLDLIARIGGEFGISIVVSSHLLGEVERICDHVVALERGGLLRADTMTSFTRVSQVLSVEVDEGRQEIAGHGGVIHDLGYQHYDGPRLGRAAIIRALYWHSLRSAFGIGRGVRAKIVPILTFVLMCLPAVANAISAARGGGRIVPYDTY